MMQQIYPTQALSYIYMNMHMHTYKVAFICIKGYVLWNKCKAETLTDSTSSDMQH